MLRCMAAKTLFLVRCECSRKHSLYLFLARVFSHALYKAHTYHAIFFKRNQNKINAINNKPPKTKKTYSISLGKLAIPLKRSKK